MYYDDMYNQISSLKKNRTKMTLNEQVKRIIMIIGEHPDAIHMFKNWFMDPKQVKELENSPMHNNSLVLNILNNCQIQTTNSNELTYKYFGYCKVITPESMDQLIDAIATRIQLEKEYAQVLDVNPYIVREEDTLTLNELEQFS